MQSQTGAGEEEGESVSLVRRGWLVATSPGSVVDSGRPLRAEAEARQGRARRTVVRTLMAVADVWDACK